MHAFIIFHLQVQVRPIKWFLDVQILEIIWFGLSSKLYLNFGYSAKFEELDSSSFILQ